MEKKKKDIFFQNNLLIGFVLIVFLLLAFNYFYPVFSFKTLNFNEDFDNVGRLYQGREDSRDPGECDYDLDCGYYSNLDGECKYCNWRGRCENKPDVGYICNTIDYLCGDGKLGTCVGGKCIIK